MKQMFARVSVLALLLSASTVSCTGDSSEQPPVTPPEGTKAQAPVPSEPAAEPEEFAEPLLAWAEAEPEDGTAPLEVHFTADIEGGTPPLTVKWTFGDESPPSSEANPVHTYTKPGSYRADLEVSDAGGDSDSDWVEIEVE